MRVLNSALIRSRNASLASSSGFFVGFLVLIFTSLSLSRVFALRRPTYGGRNL